MVLDQFNLVRHVEASHKEVVSRQMPVNMCIVKLLFALSKHTLTMTVDPPHLEGWCGHLQNKYMKLLFL